MKKLKLDLDNVQVESFETSARGEGEATVHGYDSDGGDWNYTNSCPGTTCPGGGCPSLPGECPETTP